MAAVEKPVLHGPPPMEIDKRFWGNEPHQSNLNTEYLTRFLGGPSSPVQPHYPKDNGCFTYDVSSPLNPNTCYGVNYTDFEEKKKATKKKTKPTPLCLRPPSAEEAAFSVYRDQYRPKDGFRQEIIRPDPPDHRPTEGNQTNQKITLKQEMHRLFTVEEAKNAIRTPCMKENHIIWNPEEPHVGSVNTKEDPFLEIRPGLKKPKQNFPVIQSIQQSDYSFKPLNPAGLFLSATWKAPKIIFKTKSSFQDQFPAYERKWHRPASFKPVGKFKIPNHRESQPTTYGLDFQRHINKIICAGPPDMMKRPLLPEKGNFQSSNQYQDKFWDKSKLRQHREPNRPQQIPTASTQRDHFRGIPGKRRSPHYPKVLDRIE